MGRGQILLVAVGICLVVLIYLAPSMPTTTANVGEESAMEASAAPAYDIAQDLTEARNGMTPETLQLIDELEATMEGADDASKAATLDSLSKVLDGMRKPDAGAIYLAQKAELTNDLEDWKVLGERYMVLGKYFEGDQNRKSAWFQECIRSYRNANELAPEDIDVQIDLGVALVEGATYTGGMPMEGIGYLRKAVELDPTNPKGHFYLGYFSERSGQLDKALERYAKVLELDPENKQTHLYLAQVHEKMDNKAGAIEHLNEFRASLTDPKSIAEVDRQIETLQN